MVMAGRREGSMYKELKRVVLTAAALGGTILGPLSATADRVGAIGSGTGILMAVTIVYSCRAVFSAETTLIAHHIVLLRRLGDWHAGASCFYQDHL
ncbi:hypothetical protein IEO21_08312 [Rhodonia placenta]|uniref:Uncharacterized protein n=1 Tax=Rhodonia placenta TaxID=104341 RepID=A0A8H7TZI2_9APHY|nr:hypothetical protein IEO21_08312 [Postia placenta]